MTKIKFILGLAAIAAVSVNFTLQAQTNAVSTTAASEPNGSSALPTNAPSINGGLVEIYNAIAASGLTTATNYAVEPYLTYAPDAPSANRIGAGALIIYNISHFVGAGIGVDYLGQFSLVSANVTLKVPTHPFAFLGNSWMNLAVAPFALVGVGVPLSGASEGFSAITDTGAYIQFGHAWGGRFNAGACYGRWDNAGAYTGPRYHFFLGWSKGF